MLRIGTTGDYPPLTFLDPKTQQYCGSDIALIEAFAKAQSLSFQFISTTWVTLNQDLLDDRFDLAVGGISATPGRSKLFLLSVSLGRSGKVPLVRCEDVLRYQTFTAINQAKVRVVENPGGTNAAFAKAFLTKAQVIITQDNEEPFQYLLSGQADVMITDSIEARYREKIMPGLCAVSPERFLDEGAAQVVLFQKQHLKLQKRFNQWFEESR